MIKWTIGVCFINLISVSLSFAGDLYVPRDFVTIQQAVDAATTGDTIYVNPGTYSESVIVTKGINLTGIGTPIIVPPPPQTIGEAIFACPV